MFKDIYYIKKRLTRRVINKEQTPGVINKEAYQVFREGTRPSYLRLYARITPITKYDRIMNSLVPLEIRSKGGLYLGNDTGIKMEPKRINNILMKIAKGLYFHYYEKSIPDNYSPKVYFEPKDLLLSLIDKLKGKKMLKAGLFGNVFSYMGARTKDDKFVSIWWLSFYQTFGAIVVIDKSNNFFA